jgi:hypothetical protein
MPQCEVCGNEYYLAFEVVTAGNRHVFDSFECAIHKLAPVCAHCGVKVVGHGVDANGDFYCCAHCARATAPATCRTTPPPRPTAATRRAGPPDGRVRGA